MCKGTWWPYRMKRSRRSRYFVRAVWNSLFHGRRRALPQTVDFTGIFFATSRQLRPKLIVVHDFVFLCISRSNKMTTLWSYWLHLTIVPVILMQIIVFFSIGRVHVRFKVTCDLPHPTIKMESSPVEEELATAP